MPASSSRTTSWPSAAQLLVVLGQLVELVRLGGDVDDAGALVVAVDLVVRDRGLDVVEGLEPHLLEHRQLGRGSAPGRWPRRG